MSSSVSPRQRDIGEVASLRAEGVDPQPRSGFPASLGLTHSREAAFLQVWQSCNVDSCHKTPLFFLTEKLSPLSTCCAREQGRTLRACQLRCTQPQTECPRYRAAEEDIATYPLSTAHHTLTENTPYRSNRRENIATPLNRNDKSQKTITTFQSHIQTARLLASPTSQP